MDLELPKPTAVRTGDTFTLSVPLPPLQLAAVGDALTRKPSKHFWTDSGALWCSVTEAELERFQRERGRRALRAWKHRQDGLVWPWPSGFLERQKPLAASGGLRRIQGAATDRPLLHAWI